MSTVNIISYWGLRVLLILIGGLFIIFGEFDDSPGLQGIGLILIIVTVFKIIKSKKITILKS